MIGPVRRDPPADARDAADWWSARRRLGLLSERDEAAFQAWLADPDHRAAWHATDDVIEAAGAFASAPDIRAMREAALDASPRAHRRWRWAMLPAAAAAAIIAWTGATQLTPFGRPSIETVASQRFAVPAGQRREIALSDGSRVTLDTDSLIDVAFTAGRRDVRLVRGQALFHVARDPGRPFVVAAGDRHITAVGTAFDVRLEAGGAVKVLLVEGHVTVEPSRPTGLARIVPAIAREALSPGEALTAGPDTNPNIVPADVTKGTSWSRGQLVFRNDPLATVVAEMNRYTTAPVTVADERLGRLPVSGVFSTDRADGFAGLIASAYALHVVRGPGGAVTIMRNDEGSKKIP